MTLVVGPRVSGAQLDAQPSAIRLAFVNNMPDAAFDATEAQFLDVIRSASTDMNVEVALYSLRGIDRNASVQARLDRTYRPLDELWESAPHALVITGTEPRAADLREEPYFDELARLLSWAERTTVSTVVSCLAAHAALLVFDALERVPLPRKCSGVFENAVMHPHPLVDGLGVSVLIPHSRLNGVPSAALDARGYTVLLAQTPASWTLAVKQRGDCLFVLNQGHPEYGTETLLREYRRDVRRFLGGEQSAYPVIPEGYLDPADRARLDRFRAANTGGATPGEFPYDEISPGIVNSWRRPAEQLYANWLRVVAQRAYDACMTKPS